MKVKKLLALQSIIEDRKIPYDMNEEHYYYSESKDQFLEILEMDLHHLIRAFKKLNESKEIEEPVLIKNDTEIYVKENFVDGLSIVQVLKMLEKKLLEKDYDLENILTEYLSEKRNEH
tara:strand:+ start:211 stop:564 length:354 start_codon:yes stop_codon:yes gene_type:complete